MVVVVSLTRYGCNRAQERNNVDDTTQISVGDRLKRRDYRRFWGLQHVLFSGSHQLPRPHIATSRQGSGGGAIRSEIPKK